MLRNVTSVCTHVQKKSAVSDATVPNPKNVPKHNGVICDFRNLINPALIKKIAIQYTVIVMWLADD